MNSFLTQLARGIDTINEWAGRIIAWLTSILVIFMCYDVLMRYFFNQTSIWITELEWHLFALIFLIGAAYTLKHDAHVRVDVFYTKFNPTKKAIINILGTIFFLIPFCLIIIKSSFSYAEMSFNIGERSPDPGGLPARYIIKGSITFGFGLLLIQAIGEVIKSSLILIESRENA